MMSDYEIHEDQILGEGGMGTVCRGRQISLDRVVAIKIIRNDLTDTPTYVERFRREAELLGQVIDGHVVQVFGAGEWNGRLFYAMEFVEGEDLASRLQRGQVFRIEDILHIAHGVGRALKAAWKYRIVHRDIKPSNILITSDDRVKVADFGLARSLARAPVHTMTIAGTAKYLSPEQGMGDPVDIRSDIYSLGVVLYELATRQAPFEGDSPTSVIYSHIHSQPQAVKELCPTLRDDVAALIMKCLAKRPEDRFQSPDEFLDAVSWIRAQLDPQAVHVPLNRKPARFNRRPAMLVFAAICGPILVAALAYASWSRLSDDEASRDHHRKAIDLALGVGEYEAALKLARDHFGTESREFLKANKAYRNAKVDQWTKRAQAAAADKNWKETLLAYETMLQFADGERKDQVTAGMAFFKDLDDADKALAEGQWERAQGLYQSMKPPTEDLRDHVHENSMVARSELVKAKEREAEALMAEARAQRNRGSWSPALETARKAKGLISPFQEPSADINALIKELDKAVAAPQGFAFIPAGPFLMGSDPGSAAASPRHSALTGAFYMAERAVTRGEYAKFLEDERARTHKLCAPEEPRDKNHTPDGWTPDLPKDEAVTGVDWYDALAYARWAGLRLPTEAEWEKAAAFQLDENRSRTYPWGDAPDGDAKDISFFGVQGMARGPREWTQSLFEAYPGSKAPTAEFAKGYRVLRGGLVSPDNGTMISPVTTRQGRLPSLRDRRIGFRCVKDIDLP
jgi:serine/threonine protein kinase/formylglycine-generating enzyme required for sulfatase activity